MGQYFRIVCHDCREMVRPRAAKLREIALSPQVAAEVGWFATQHAGHRLELCGDEWTGTQDLTGYKTRNPTGDNDDVIRGRAELDRWKDAALVPTPPESRDTPTTEVVAFTFDGWFGLFLAHCGIAEGSATDHDTREYCRASWNAGRTALESEQRQSAAVAAGGAAGATTAAAQEKP